MVPVFPWRMSDSRNRAAVLSRYSENVRYTCVLRKFDAKE